MIFVDANVLLYAEDLAFPEKQQRSQVWLRHLWTTRKGLISAQVLNEYFHNATRKLRHPVAPKVAWKTVKSFYAWNPRAIDCDLIDHAHEVQARYRLSWWDSLIGAAAIDQRASVLLSEDLHDGLDLDGTVVRSPFTLSPGEPLHALQARQPPPRHARSRKAL